MLHTNTAAEERLVIESGPGRTGPLAWTSASLLFEPQADGGGNWRFELQGTALAGVQGNLLMSCDKGGLRQGRPWCAQGQFEWLPAGADAALAGRLFAPPERAGIGLDLFEGQARLTVPWPAPGQAATARVEFDGLDLAALPEGLVETFWSGPIEGQVDGSVVWNGEAIEVQLALAEGGFDSPDGRFAGAGLALTLVGEVVPPEEDGGPLSFSFELAQQAGELLADTLYLPEPEQAVHLQLDGRLQADGMLVVTQFDLDDGPALSATGRFELAAAEEDRRLQRLVIDSANLNFPAAFARWGEGPAGAYGLGDLQTEGRLAASLEWRRGQSPSFLVELDGLGLEDERGRFAVDGLDGRIESRPEHRVADVDWQGLQLFRLNFGASTLQASAQAGDWQLSEPLVLPLLDGRVVIESMTLQSEQPWPTVTLDARIEPLELTELTRMLGLPEFGGSLSGQFPGIEFGPQRIAFTGGIDVQAFSGAIRLRDLIVERPFGSLPALAAQVEFDRLDLAQLTGAFNFGHMEGQLSGWMRNLRLLDWRPAAMDARVFTHEDAPSRRISQQAVENLSRLGGSAAALGTSLLSIFDEFPYRRAGLACRLDRNICHMDGVAPHANGGYYILEGRLLPRLDIIGHRRLVDWPLVVAQLIAATRD